MNLTQNLPTKLNLFNRKAMPVLGRQARIGYSIVKAHSRDDSEIYGEVLKLAKAYDNVVTRESERMERLRNDLSDRYYQKLTSDYLRKSGGCSGDQQGGDKVDLWSPVDVSAQSMFDFDRAWRLGSECRLIIGGV